MSGPEKSSDQSSKRDNVGEEGLKSSKNRDSHDAPFGYQPLPTMAGFGSAVFQLLPMFLVFPIWQIARYLLFFTVLLHKSRFLPDLTDRDFLTFIMSYLLFYMAWVTIMPLSLILIKWLVIGRYQEGRYPIWGSYYLRWWFVDVCRKMILRGVWGSNDVMLRLYYRMLGANIHPGAKIGLDCDLAEYDLVTVGRNAAVELCTLRGFGVDNGAMILGRVRVGHESSVGIRSVVAPYTSVPDGQHLGPGTSTYDVTPGKALHPKHAQINRQCFPKPSLFTQVFIGTPILFMVQAFSQIPPMIVLYSLLWYKSRESSDMFFMNWNELMDWLCDPRRIPFFLGIRIARSLLSPFFYMFSAMCCKWFIIGKIQAGPRTNSEWEKFRYWLAATLFTRRKIQAVADLVGRHYENVSIMYRMLGARIGKRVFWPGNQPNINGLFDLLEIGDDVVFGSRSTLICASVDRCDKVVLCAGANVSDNCIVLPGTVIGKNAVLGSNSTSPGGAYLPARSVWFGSDGCQATCLENGDGSDASFYLPLAEEDGSTVKMIASEVLDSSQLPMVGDESTYRPFGKAFYLGMAKGYMVLPLWAIVLYSWLQRIFATIYHTLPLLAAVQFAAVMLYSNHTLKSLYYTYFSQGEYSDNYFDYGKGKYDEDANQDSFFGITRNFDNGEHYHNFFDVYIAVLTCFLFTHFFRVVGWLLIELAAKWGIMRRRKAGRYSYLTDSYAQRWELYQITAKIRKINRMNLLQFICGSPFMNWYIRLNGGKVGKGVCLYPTGADPFMPEPDLVKIGDSCIVDCASICCHLNTRGNFELAPIVLEQNCTLRARSRVQQGVHMEAGSQLLEKSIAMTGEVIDGRSVWQGGPATLWFRYPDMSSYVPPSALGDGGAQGLSYDPNKEGLELGRIL
jgi:acetyltransferase-like isoleucine patch superfamily enzyme